LAKAAGGTQDDGGIVRRAFNMNVPDGIMAGGIGHSGVTGVEEIVGFPDGLAAGGFDQRESPADGDGRVRVIARQMAEENSVAAAGIAEAGEEVAGQRFIFAPRSLAGPLAQLFGGDADEIEKLGFLQFVGDGVFEVLGAFDESFGVIGGGDGEDGDAFKLGVEGLALEINIAGLITDVGNLAHVEGVRGATGGEKGREKAKDQ